MGCSLTSGGAPKLRRGLAPVRGGLYGIGAGVPAHERRLAWRYRERVAIELEIAPISTEEFEGLLPLLAAYQRFYEVEEIDDTRNRTFFRRFLAPSEDGLLLGARHQGKLIGYACLYWHFSSLEAVESVLLNDLYVSEEARGQGVGRTLIEATAEVARERGGPLRRVVHRPRQPHRPAPL
jgi:GNAT superfamily N-acetyltransferase